MVQEVARGRRFRWLEHYGYGEDEVRTDLDGKEYILVEYGTEPFSDEVWRAERHYVDLDEVDGF